jgi:hypothetical protein
MWRDDTPLQTVTRDQGSMSAAGRGSILAVIKSHLITQAIAVVCFVVVPVAITLVAPLSTIVFQKAGSETDVIVQRYALMVVPWRTERIDAVTQIRADVSSQFRYGNTAENRRKNRVGTVSYATGQVVIIGPNDEVIVQAAPDLARSIAAQFKDFVADQNADRLSIPVYASWALSYGLGGVVSFLCGLYLFGSMAAILRFLLRSNQK